MKILILSAMLSMTGCAATTQNGWHRIGRAPEPDMYVNGNYTVIKQGKLYRLKYRPPGDYIDVGLFPSLQSAEAMAEDLRPLHP